MWPDFFHVNINIHWYVLKNLSWKYHWHPGRQHQSHQGRPTSPAEFCVGRPCPLCSLGDLNASSFLTWRSTYGGRSAPLSAVQPECAWQGGLESPEVPVLLSCALHQTPSSWNLTEDTRERVCYKYEYDLIQCNYISF